jgi:hypothetical protein
LRQFRDISVTTTAAIAASLVLLPFVQVILGVRCDSRFLFFALTVQTIAPAMVPDEFPVMMEAAVVDMTGNHRQQSRRTMISHRSDYLLLVEERDELRRCLDCRTSRINSG